MIRDERGELSNLDFYGEEAHRWNFLAVLYTYIGPEFLSIVDGVVNINSVGHIGDMEVQSAMKIGLPMIDVRPADARRDPQYWRDWDFKGVEGYDSDMEDWIDFDNLEVDEESLVSDVEWIDYDNMYLEDI